MNNRCAAERIKSDKVESVATGAVHILRIWKIGTSQNLKSVVLDAVKIGNVGQVGTSENSKMTTKSRFVKKSNCASQTSKASQGPIVQVFCLS